MTAFGAPRSARFALLRLVVITCACSSSAAATLPDSATGDSSLPAGGGNADKRFDSEAVFRDNVQSYTTVEPAIDLTATSPLAFAWQFAGQ